MTSNLSKTDEISPDIDSAELVAKVVSGNRLALAKVVTLLESKRASHRTSAEAILSSLMPHAGNSIRIGISGPPGVGKSTFIEALGLHFLSKNQNVAVLAIDPTSPITGGSILGDKTRMDLLARDPRAFIRPSPSSGNLGGVTRHTREAIVACEAAGFKTILVETVGVGQSEVAVASMVDVFVALQLPNSGDELQAIKKGILELADIVVVNKADGGLLPAAKLAKAELERAISLVRSEEGGIPKVLLASSISGNGIPEVYSEIEARVHAQKKISHFGKRRSEQALAWFHAEIGEQLKDRLESLPRYQSLISDAETSAATGKIPGSTAARLLIESVFSGA